MRPNGSLQPQEAEANTGMWLQGQKNSGNGQKYRREKYSFRNLEDCLVYT